METGLQQQGVKTTVLATACIALVFFTISCGAGGSDPVPPPTTKAPAATVSAASLSFGSHAVDATSAAQVVTLTNSGNATLSITGIAVTGTNASDFAQTNTCGSSVGAGANCTISVTFTPTATGSRSASLTITDNAANSPQAVGLSGTGTNSPAPAVTLSTANLTFSNQAVGTTSTAQAVSLTNSGNATLSITGIAVTGTNASDFAQSNTCGSSVAAGANCTISVTFTPTATGSRSASLSITDNAANSPQTVSLIGTGSSTYYVDNCVVVGSDSNKGTSPSAPWLTINKVNSSTFKPGDSILLRRTCTWREQLTVPSSGSAASPITFGAYGTGTPPIFDGADVFSSWITEGSLYYSAAPTQPNQIFRDGARLTAVTAKGNLTTGDWWWDSTNYRIYVYDNPSGHTMEAGQRPYGVQIWGGVNYVRVDSISVTMADGYGGIAISKSNYVTISNCDISYSWMNGIWVWNTSAYSDYGVVQGCTVTNSGGPGIAIGNYSRYWTVQGNTVHDNCVDPTNSLWSGGIYITGGAVTYSITVENNDVYSNGIGVDHGSGIYIDTGPTNNIIRWNKVHDNAFNNIYVEVSPNNYVYGNLAYGSLFGSGIFIAGRADGPMHDTVVYNNTMYNNADTGLSASSEDASAGSFINNRFENNIATGNGTYQLSAGAGADNDGTAGYGNVYTYNAFGAQSSNFIQWGWGVYKSSYAAWETAYCGTTGCSHSVQADPQFVNASASQFWLADNSPAIDAGSDLGGSYNMDLLPVSSWPDAVLTGDQNSYGTRWEVGAYIFTGQTIQ
jgi:parallel beta-helix repeat protein